MPKRLLTTVNNEGLWVSDIQIELYTFGRRYKLGLCNQDQI